MSPSFLGERVQEPNPSEADTMISWAILPAKAPCQGHEETVVSFCIRNIFSFRAAVLKFEHTSEVPRRLVQMQAADSTLRASVCISNKWPAEVKFENCLKPASTQFPFLMGGAGRGQGCLLYLPDDIPRKIQELTSKSVLRFLIWEPVVLNKR